MRRLQAERCALLLVGWQDRAYRSLDERTRRGVLDRAVRLKSVAERLDLPRFVTELDARSYGRVLPQLGQAGRPLSHTMLSAAHDGRLQERLAAAGRDTVVISGLETHLVLTHTVLDLLDQGLRVVVPPDTTTARNPSVVFPALARLRQEGARLVVTEGVVFEWVPDARDPLFHDLVRQHR